MMLDDASVYVFLKEISVILELINDFLQACLFELIEIMIRKLMSLIWLMVSLTSLQIRWLAKLM